MPITTMQQRWAYASRTALAVLVMFITLRWTLTGSGNSLQASQNRVSNKVPTSNSEHFSHRTTRHKNFTYSNESTKAPWWKSLNPISTQYRYMSPMNGKLVAIGDVHGDVNALTRALLLAKAIDTKLNWIGDDLVIVQMGDNLDRGQDEIAVLKLLTKLHKQAELFGGAVHAVLGNHEIMNVLLDFRYASPLSLPEYDTFRKTSFVALEGDADADIVEGGDNNSTSLQENDRVSSLLFARARAYRPGGFLAASVLASRRAVLIIGDSVFVHGGLLPEHVNHLERINDVVREWLLGSAVVDDFLMRTVESEVSIFWTRRYSQDVDEALCDELRNSLSRLNVSRLVVGHTPQEHGITQGCNGTVWRIDTG